MRYIESVFRNDEKRAPGMIDQMPKSERRERSTLAQVARAAGVSVATASRALNGENGPLRAGPAARANKIRQMAQKLENAFRDSPLPDFRHLDVWSRVLADISQESVARP